MKYSELPTKIAAWVNRTDIDSDTLDDFVCLAEAEIFRELRIQDNEIVLTYDSGSSAGSFLTLPYDYYQVKRITWGGKPLSHISDAAIADRLSRNYDSEVNAFAIVGTQLVFSEAIANDPADWGANELVITYYASECVFDKNKDLYIKGGMFYAHEFLQKSDEAKKWSARFYSALESVKKMGKRAELSGSTSTVVSPYGDD